MGLEMRLSAISAAVVFMAMGISGRLQAQAIERDTIRTTAITADTLVVSASDTLPSEGDVMRAWGSFGVGVDYADYFYNSIRPTMAFGIEVANDHIALNTRVFLASVNEHAVEGYGTVTIDVAGHPLPRVMVRAGGGVAVYGAMHSDYDNHESGIGGVYDGGVKYLLTPDIAIGASWMFAVIASKPRTNLLATLALNLSGSPDATNDPSPVLPVSPAPVDTTSSYTITAVLDTTARPIALMPEYDSAAPPSAGRHIIHAELATLFGLIGSASMNYERILDDNVTLGGGVAFGWAHELFGGGTRYGSAATAMLRLMSGGPAKFEFATGVSVVNLSRRASEPTVVSLLPALQLGYRYQPARGAIYRIGLGYAHGTGAGLHVGVGQVF